MPLEPWRLNPRKMGEGLYQPLAEINVTPLVDLLLLIVMVTAPMLTTGIKVNLPAAKTPELLEYLPALALGPVAEQALSRRGATF